MLWNLDPSKVKDAVFVLDTAVRAAHPINPLP